jgi:hypothetical protein
LGVSSAYAADKVDCEALRKTNKLAKRIVDHSGEQKVVETLLNEKNTLIMKKDHLTPEDIGRVQGKVDDLAQIVRREHLSKVEDVAGPLSRIKSLAKAINESQIKGLAAEELERRKNLVSRKAVELQESFDAFQYVDENSGKRVVVVSLSPVSQARWFTPLSLMDYVYFTISITTTGSGDIVPATAFAKFLCSAASILEVFFLVVFFNVLLSVKGENRLIRSRDKKLK